MVTAQTPRIQPKLKLVSRKKHRSSVLRPLYWSSLREKQKPEQGELKKKETQKFLLHESGETMSMDLSEFTIIKEGEAEILMHPKNEVFYNKTQVPKFLLYDDFAFGGVSKFEFLYGFSV